MLTLAERVKVIDLAEKGNSARAIARSLGVGKTQVQGILAKKTSILKSWKAGTNGKLQYLAAKKNKNGDLNQLVWDWFTKARSRNFVITGPILQEKARELANDKGLTTFKASNGWLESFRKRYGAKSSKLSGMAAEMEDWKLRLSRLCEGYSLDNIFNADETGLFYRTLPTRSLVANGHHCEDGKKAKERMTVLLTASATGEKLKPLVIGKSANPRCFRGVHRAALGVEYEANRKAWMTSDLFQAWLEATNNKFSSQQRQVLLFVDNCPAHPDIRLSHIKLVFLPANMTSTVQPMDAGIIQTIKLKYRKRMVRHLLGRMDENETASQLAKQISMLDAVQWIQKAWQEVKESTIRKCYKKCGFSVDVPTDEEKTEAPEEADNTDPLISKVLDGVSIEEFVSFDDNTATTQTQADDCEEEVVRATREDAQEDVADCDSENSLEEDDGQTSVTWKEAQLSISHLSQYALTNGLEDLRDIVGKASDIIDNLELKRQSQLQQGPRQGHLDSGVVHVSS